MARLAHSEEVPVPPFALRKRISRPPLSLALLSITGTAVGRSEPNIRLRLSSSAAIACDDLTMYSLTPALRLACLRAGLGSVERASSGIFLVRESFRNF